MSSVFVPSWTYPSLNEICDVRDGTHDSPKYVENGFPLITSKNLRPEGLDFGNVNYISQDDYDAIEKRSAVSDGDILFGMIGTVGNPVIVRKNRLFSVKNVAIFKFHDHLTVLNKYLFYVLNSDYVARQIAKESKGGTQQFVSLKVLRALKIPLPPIETQKQIAAVLEKADQLRKDCQQMEQELNNLAQSVFIDMFGDPVTNPKGWSKVPLSLIVSDYLGGKSLVAADDESTEYRNKVLKISAVTSGEFNPSEVKPLPNDYEPPEGHFVQKGDLLFSRANTTELVGATTMVFDDYEGLALPDKLWRFVWADENNISPVFIWQQLSNIGMRAEISKLSSGSGGSMKNISKGKLKTLEVIFPPLGLQVKYEEMYLKLRTEKLHNASMKRLVEEGFSSLMQRAFKGELNLTPAQQVA